ncbi:MAG: hypothetical protein A2Z88_02280 [Omnitrophica WOR_2 bacterium GWA2_47_8]|nr:MAG: hypothetical protein A2Z88_02280 [Omnitrophica WOR_2 bacterium GWA2_47_8]
MYIPDFFVYTFGIVFSFYLFAGFRDRKQEKRNAAELYWFRLKAEYMEDPEKFSEKSKEQVLLNHSFLKKVYKHTSRETILNDLKQKSFMTTTVYASFMHESYGD